MKTRLDDGEAGRPALVIARVNRLDAEMAA